MADRVMKVKLKEEVMRLALRLEPGSTVVEKLETIRSTIQRGFGLSDSDSAQLVCRYMDDEDDLCTLNATTLDDWLALFPEGPLRLHADLKPARADDMICQRLVPTIDLTGNKDDTALPEAPGSVARLLHLVQSSDEHIWRGAADKLCTAAGTGDREAVDAVSSLTSKGDEYVRRASTNILCVLAGSGNQQALAALRPLTSSGDESIRRASADALCSAASNGDEDSLAALESMASSSDEHIRRAVGAVAKRTSSILGSSSVEVSAKRPREESRPSASLDDGCKLLASLRIEAIAGSSVAVEQLAEMTKDRTEQVRRGAAEALVAASAHGLSSATAAIGPLAHHGDEHIRRRVTESLVASALAGRDEALLTLRPLTTHGDEHVRRSAAQALCSAPTVCRGDIEQLTSHSDEYIRRLAAGVLCRCA
mmetsp:Transcript_68600/g.200723  ORF Transcript_68600/g.200723 Transcript_68600/m.200723 type:complete len:424 (+) Transcript_68600:92-1363(+)